MQCANLGAYISLHQLQGSGHDGRVPHKQGPYTHICTMPYTASRSTTGSTWCGMELAAHWGQNTCKLELKGAYAQPALEEASY